MKTYKVHIDISNIFHDIKNLNIREYYQPFIVKFMQGKNPDDICHKVLVDIIRQILKKDKSISNRIFCRSIKYKIRFDKLYTS
jgi:hypothetical protein